MKEDPDARNPLRAFTVPARVLVVVSILFGGVVFCFSIDNDFFPPGFYPIIVLWLPGIGAALGLFCVGCLGFWLSGVTVWKEPVNGSDTPDENACPTTDDPNPDNGRTNRRSGA